MLPALAAVPSKKRGYPGMNQIFFREIDKLKQHLVCMFKLVEKNFTRAVKALTLADADAAEQVFAGEKAIDEKKIDLQEECFKVLALHQPVAFDLRFIMATLKFNNDLERIGDLSLGMADRSRSLAALPAIAPPFDHAAMAGKVHAMLATSLDALLHLDPAQGRAVLAAEEEINALHRENLRLVRDEILRAPGHIDALINYLSVSRYLERIADLTTNLAEEVIYIVEGDFVHPQGHSEDPVG